MTDQNKLKLYNTLTRKKEDFVPIDDKNVRMYVCGPTVYDFAHIGNARPVIVFDVLSRLLRHVYGKDQVTYVRNITDVDDKINARALRDYPDLPLNDAIHKVTQKTTEQFHADIKALGCLPPDQEPRATQHISGMIEMAQTLVNKGHAYVAKGEQGYEVLFDVVAMPNYGGLSNRKLEDQQAGARVEVTNHKKNAGDFVLWKQSGDTEPGWDARFTQIGETYNVRGRPGWHIECSVMSEYHLGKTFDIHGGGLDLIFPHHENEIAQSCCAHGTDKMANIWMHNGYLQVEGKKMSKSVGNFVTINDLLETTKFGGRKWPGEVLRLAMLMTHYREPIDFSIKRLEEAEVMLKKWMGILLLAGLSFQEGNKELYQDKKISVTVIDAISDDLNFSKVITELHKLNKSSDIYDGHTLYASLSFLGLTNFEQMAVFESEDESKIPNSGISDNIIEKKVELRSSCISDKNWAEADRIRDELLSQGIQLKDGKDPETGKRVTTWEVKR